MEVCHFFIYPSVWHGIRIGLVRFYEVGIDEIPLDMQQAWFVVVKLVTMAHFTRTWPSSDPGPHLMIIGFRSWGPAYIISYSLKVGHEYMGYLQ